MPPPLFGVLIDISGTILVEDAAIPGAVEAIRALIANSKFGVKFVTNTTKESSTTLLSRLHALGFDSVKQEDVFTSLTAARRLTEERKLRPLLLLEDDALTDFAGVDTTQPNAVVVGLAPFQFYWERLNEAFRLLIGNKDSELIAVHKGRYFQQKTGLSLGPGPFVASLEYATGKTSTVVGKPNDTFFKQGLASLPGDVPLSRSIMIGDDVRDDVVGALRTGLRGALVQTGKYRPGDEEAIPAELRPRAVITPSVVEVLRDITANPEAFFSV